MPQPANGSTVSWQTDWPFIQEVAATFGIPVNDIRVKLNDMGLTVGPTDRLPFPIIEEAALAMIADGYQPVRLKRASLS